METTEKVVVRQVPQVECEVVVLMVAAVRWSESTDQPSTDLRRVIEGMLTQISASPNIG